MLKSMTGYGRGIAKRDDIEITVEVRSVNNRFLDLVLKLPRTFSNFEQKVRELVAKYVRRGRINVWIGITSGDDKYRHLSVNKDLVDVYLRAAKDLSEKLDIEHRIDIDNLLTLPDIFVAENEENADEETWQCIDEALSCALEELNAMRVNEGEALWQDFDKRIQNLEHLIQTIDDIAVNRPPEEFKKLRERVSKLFPAENCDEGRLEQELAILADRIDITEECVRFRSHNRLFMELLNGEEAQGRKLNFLLQEMNREANTIGAKATSAEISHLVVNVKEEIERIREQVQNVE
jgi:uncharacterized protein (TIGR00255 family)